MMIYAVIKINLYFHFNGKCLRENFHLYIQFCVQSVIELKIFISPKPIFKFKKFFCVYKTEPNNNKYFGLKFRGRGFEVKVKVVDMISSSIFKIYLNNLNSFVLFIQKDNNCYKRGK